MTTVGGSREPVQSALAADDPRGSGAAGRCHAPEADVAVVLGGHHDRSAVGRPERPNVQGPTRAVERRGQANGLTTLRRHREELDVAAIGVEPSAGEKRDRAPVGRERGQHDRPRRRREPLRISSLRRHAPEIARVVVVARGVTGRREHDRFAVGRPDGVGVEEVAVADLSWARAVERDDEDVRAPIVDEPLAVEAILHRGDDSRGA
jgi:hypothetical protein